MSDSTRKAIIEYEEWLEVERNADAVRLLALQFKLGTGPFKEPKRSSLLLYVQSTWWSGACAGPPATGMLSRPHGSLRAGTITRSLSAEGMTMPLSVPGVVPD